jgi:F-type H+-transporting ATPase subunit a
MIAAESPVPSIETAESPISFPAHFLGFDNWINVSTVSLFVFCVLLVMFLLARRNLKLVPTGLQNFFELVIDFVKDLAYPIVGEKHAETFFPFFFYLFLFIFFSNLMGLIPGLLSPTSRVDMNVGMALIVFFSTQIMGVWVKGIHYFAHFLPPKVSADPKSPWPLKLMMNVIYIALLIMMPFIHLAGELIKPVSLTMRLFGNMMGKEKVLGVCIILVLFFWNGAPLFKVMSSFPFLLRVAIVVLGVFISFIQAFVFMLLAMVYLGGAVQGHEEHEGHEGEAGEAAHS